MGWIPFLIVVIATLLMMGLIGAVQIYLELILDGEADSSAGGSVWPTRR